MTIRKPKQIDERELDQVRGAIAIIDDGIENDHPVRANKEIRLKGVVVTDADLGAILSWYAGSCNHREAQTPHFLDQILTAYGDPALGTSTFATSTNARA